MITKMISAMAPVRRALVQVGYIAGLPAVLVVLWGLATQNSTNFFVTTPSELWTTFVDTWIGDRFAADVLPSLARFAIGAGLAIALGVGLGIPIGLLRWLRRLTEPLFEFFRAMPPPVLVPVLMLLIGVNDAMKIVVIVSGAIWPVLLNTVEGVRAVDPVLRDTARTYGIGGLAQIRHVVLPSASPQIFAGIRQSLSIALILMVISEMFASSEGIGLTIVTFQRTFAVPEMWSGVLMLGLIGFVVSVVFQISERRVLRWYHGQRKVHHGR
jgi:ABC-type nitrate/sulfonate/bicarbonate transport system permease component